MPRMDRIIVPGAPHHITHRGNNRENIFRSDTDQELYLKILKKYSEKYKLNIMGYCLMSNHVHIIGVPTRKDSIEKVIRIGHMSYTKLFNYKYNRIGHLWHSRYHSCVLDDRHLFAALVYVEQNPVRAGIVNYAWQYPWSSASAHIIGQDVKGVVDFKTWDFDRENWIENINQYQKDGEVELIRAHTKSGMPMYNQLALGTDPNPSLLKDSSELVLR